MHTPNHHGERCHVSITHMSTHVFIALFQCDGEKEVANFVSLRQISVGSQRRHDHDIVSCWLVNIWFSKHKLD